VTHGEQPVAGSLSAKVIRACTKHQNKCDLTCPRRKVEDLGEVASFESHQTTLMYGNVEPTFRERLGMWLRNITHPGGS
jgi:hypothetical protein